MPPNCIGYIFTFHNGKKLTLFCLNYFQAMQYLSIHPEISQWQIIDMKCFRPLLYVTIKSVDNGDFLWVGKDSPDGWRKLYNNVIS